LPVYTTGRALGNILFGLNMGSINEISWFPMQLVWNMGMKVAGAYNNGTYNDDAYYGEHPYSGSYIYYGFWGYLKPSY
jgi:hypothetical protein